MTNQDAMGSDQELPQKDSSSKPVSRRRFIKGASVASAGAAVAWETSASIAAAADATSVRKITIPQDLLDSMREELVPISFEGRGMTGAQIFARVCKQEGLAALFCAPGNYQIINAIAAEGVPCYGGRTEGSMCAAADGFVRVTGQRAATSGTEGPGLTNMIMNISAAAAARTPLLVLASNKSISGEDAENGIQQQYQQPLTTGIKKYGKRLITPNRVYEYGAYAFRQLKSGVPGPVHLDFPGEIVQARYADVADSRTGAEAKSKLTHYFEPSQYRTDTKPYPGPGEVRRAVDMLQKSERPMIVASAGVFYDGAWDELRALAEANDIAVVESGPSRGHFSDAHELSASTAPDALLSADLVIFVGQYSMPPIGEYAFSPDARTIRIHPQVEDIGRNWPTDLGIVSHAKEALAALADAVPRRKRKAWVAELAAARQKFEEENEQYYQKGLEYSQSTGALHPACIATILGSFLYDGQVDPEQTTVVSGGYGIARYTRRTLRAYRPGQICNGPYQYGAIGPDIGYTMGVGAAVQLGVGAQSAHRGAPVVCVTGDAGAAYSIMELDTITKYRIPAIVIVYNNNAWGVFGSGRRNAARGRTRAMHMYLFQENLRYEKIAEGLGCRGEYVTNPSDFEQALQRSYTAATKSGESTLINCQAIKEFWNQSQFRGASFLGKVEPGCLAYYH